VRVVKQREIMEEVTDDGETQYLVEASWINEIPYWTTSVPQRRGYLDFKKDGDNWTFICDECGEIIVLEP